MKEKFVITPLNDFMKNMTLVKNWYSIKKNDEPFYDLEYLKVQQNYEEGEVYISLYIFDENYIFYPFILTKIKKSINTQNEDIFDIKNPYSYGGPLVHIKENRDKEKDLKNFYKKFDEYIQKKGIISEFVRFNPLINKEVDWSKFYSMKKECENIIVNLKDHSTEGVYFRYSKVLKKNIKRQLNYNLTFKIEEQNEQIYKKFYSLYKENMKALEAKKYFYFNEKYFKSLSKIKKNLISVMSLYDKNKEMVSSLIILFSKNMAHYHLGCKNLNSNIKSTSHLLLHNSIIESKKRGIHFFHLGGATKEQKGLYQFKNFFSNDKIDYLTGSRIINNTIYEKLVLEWKKNKSRKEVSNFFPLYNS